MVGHVPYGFFQEHLRGRALYLTFLREPVDRVLSLYYGHIHRRPDPSAQQAPVVTDSIEEALEMRLPELNDLATRFLCGHPSPLGDLPRGALEAAKANLRDFAFVGIQERFNESAALLQRTFRLGSVPYESRHINPDRPTVEQICDAQRSLIAESNQLDAELYEFAKDLFDKAVATADDGLSTDAEALRKLSTGGKKGSFEDGS